MATRGLRWKAKGCDSCYLYSSTSLKSSGAEVRLATKVVSPTPLSKSCDLKPWSFPFCLQSCKTRRPQHPKFFLRPGFRQKGCTGTQYQESALPYRKVSSAQCRVRRRLCRTLAANELAPSTTQNIDTSSNKPPASSNTLPHSSQLPASSIRTETQEPKPTNQAKNSSPPVNGLKDGSLVILEKGQSSNSSGRATKKGASLGKEKGLPLGARQDFGITKQGADSGQEKALLLGAKKEFEVRAAATEEELLAVARLRADMYADGLPYTRFVDSYRKQFADQEFGSLLKRTKTQTGRHLRCCCLIAVDSEALSSDAPASDYVIGTLDVSLKQLMPGQQIAGEAASEESVTFAGKRPITKARKYMYVSNVCVPERARRRGVARQMMAVAADVAKSWGYSEVFCHVDIDNKGAQQLYRNLDYEKWGEVVVQENVSGAHVSLRRTLLLRADLTSL